MEEVLFYKCIFTEGQFRIILKGMRFKPLAQVVFMDGFGAEEASGEGAGTKRPKVDKSGLPLIFMSKSDYYPCIDLLRNERPVFLVEKGKKLLLQTSDEPVGETER